MEQTTTRINNVDARTTSRTDSGSQRNSKTNNKLRWVYMDAIRFHIVSTKCKPVLRSHRNIDLKFFGWVFTFFSDKICSGGSNICSSFFYFHTSNLPSRQMTMWPVGTYRRWDILFGTKCNLCCSDKLISRVSPPSKSVVRL